MKRTVLILRIFCAAVLICITTAVTYAYALVCDLEVQEANADENFQTKAALFNQRVAESLEFETFKVDPDLPAVWNMLFGAAPGGGIDGVVTLSPSDIIVTWDAGALEMGGVMELKVKTDSKDHGLKEVKIDKAGKDAGTTLFVSGSGGVNPQLAEGGWHEVEVENMNGVKVTFGSQLITGFLKELSVKLSEESTLTNPIVEEFKLKIKGATVAPDTKKGTVTSVLIEVPKTSVTALVGTAFEEKIEEEPIVLSGEIEAEFERESDATVEGVDISSLYDGFNDQLHEREGSCTVVVPGSGD